MKTITTKEFADRLDRVWSVKLYRSRYFYHARGAAQDALAGRTHYADPETLRYFHSRILLASPIFDGLFFRIVESCGLDYENTKRGFRAVVFDIFGDAIYRPDLNQCRAKRETAERDCLEWMGSFDPIRHYIEKIHGRAASLNNEAESLLQAIKEETYA
jgi:hypothetical protein